MYCGWRSWRWRGRGPCRRDRHATHTWLNANAKWLALFPKEWHDNLTEPSTDVKWHYGYWGQFISARGTFNDRLGDYVRSTRKFRYYPRGSKCTLAAMRSHMTKQMEAVLPVNVKRQHHCRFD